MPITYTVLSGDTLSGIAQRYGTTVEQLLRDNNIENPDLIVTNDQVVINGATGGGSAPDTDGVGNTHSAKGEHQTNPFTDSKTNRESDEAKNAAETRARKEKTYTARATVIGDPSLKSNTLIKINNVGAKFGGYWWVKSVTHRINASGYLCDLDLLKDAISTEDADPSGHNSGVIITNDGSGDEGGEAAPAEPRVRIDARTGRVIGDTFLGNSLNDPNRGVTGYTQLEDGTWVPDGFFE